LQPINVSTSYPSYAGAALNHGFAGGWLTSFGNGHSEISQAQSVVPLLEFQRDCVKKPFTGKMGRVSQPLHTISGMQRGVNPFWHNQTPSLRSAWATFEM